MRKFTVPIFVGVAFLLLYGVASAGNVHFAGNPREPAFTDLGTRLQTTVDVAGLGNFSTQLNVSANGLATGTATCANPGNQNQPAGQNPAAFPVSSTGTIAVPASDIKNGRVQITVTTAAPASPVTIPGAPGCPNPGWTEMMTITNVAFTSASISIIQDTNNDTLFLEGPALSTTCTFSPATSDGPVPEANVNCS